MSSEPPVLDDPYEVVSVRRTETPPGAEGTSWHRYEIVQGKNKIKGYRQGSREDVTEAVKEIAVRLNERRSGKRGRVKLTAPQKKQQPTAAQKKPAPSQKKSAAPQKKPAASKEKPAASQKKPAAPQKKQH